MPLIVIALLATSQCPNIPQNEFGALDQQARRIVEAGNDRRAARRIIKAWRESQDPPIILTDSAESCFGEHLDKLIRQHELMQSASARCSAKQVDEVLKRLRKMKSDNISRRGALEDCVRRIAGNYQGKLTDEDLRTLADSFCCEVDLLNFVFGSAPPTRRVAYDRSAYKKLKVPSRMYKRFREFAKGACGEPDGLNVVANLDGILSYREPPGYSFDEIRANTLALQLHGLQANTQGWDVLAHKLECYFALIDFAEDLEVVNPRPDTGNSWDLRVGTTYIVSGTVPLMPTHNPAGLQETIEAIEQAKDVPPGGRIRVLTIVSEPELWYEVNAWNATNKSIGHGWVNALALIGQTISPVEDARH